MNDSLNYYYNYKEICQVSGYSYIEKFINNSYSNDIYFLKGGDCLAWGTWVNRWNFI